MKLPDPNLNFFFFDLTKKTNKILKYEYEENPRAEFPVVKLPDPNLNLFFFRFRRDEE